MKVLPVGAIIIPPQKNRKQRIPLFWNILYVPQVMKSLVASLTSYVLYDLASRVSPRECSASTVAVSNRQMQPVSLPVALHTGVVSNCFSRTTVLALEHAVSRLFRNQSGASSGHHVQRRRAIYVTLTSESPCYRRSRCVPRFTVCVWCLVMVMANSTCQLLHATSGNRREACLEMPIQLLGAATSARQDNPPRGPNRCHPWYKARVLPPHRHLLVGGVLEKTTRFVKH